MTLRCRWVVVRDREGKKWQLVFPDGRVLKPIARDSTPAPGHRDVQSAASAEATAAADAKKPVF
jgi:hypothetical protein